jgi:glycosyltransferase involved in cell wall biosynthesis
MTDISSQQQRHGNSLVAGLVSVIMPAYNAAPYVLETIDSIYSQSYRDVEIIVVDDGSTDSTVETIRRSRPEVTLITGGRGRGPAGARNAGLPFARGEYLTFFDADDIMVVDKLAKQVAFLGENPHTPAVLMDYRNFDARGPYEQTHFDSCVNLRAAMRRQAPVPTLSAQLATRILINENFSIAGSPLFRTSWLLQFGTFDDHPDLKGSEDFDFVYRMARETGVAVLDDVGFLRRLHDSNLSLQTETVLKNKLASRLKLLRTERLPAHRRLLRKVVGDYHQSLADYFGRGGAAPSLIMRHTLAAWRCGRFYPARTAKNLARLTGAGRRKAAMSTAR